MNQTTHSKVTSSHLGRDAYLYVRQSTMKQVIENTESTERQYALRQRAVALGWPQESIHVIDCDLGQSAKSVTDREGFQKLVADVGMGRAGIVLGLEVSRLARNCADWHRLLELCALSETLILDEDGLYNPNDFNDRLLLGLKGAMSEAELHLLHARLRGGILNKARRGELACALPIGLVYDAEGRVRLDPDKQVRETVALFFKTFRRVGTALGTVRHFLSEPVLFPRRVRSGVRKGELVWGDIIYSGARHLLRNPRYAGAYCYGRTRRPSRGGPVRLPQDEWVALIPGAHEGYISWEEFEDNQKRLRENAQAFGWERRKSPPREGPALLQGLAVCGICGGRMAVRYHTRRGRQYPDYICQQEKMRTRPICQSISGSAVDEAIGELLMKTLTPVSLEVAMAVQKELVARAEEADRVREAHVERARYEADLARHRFMQVDPRNRLVADELEAAWNQKLRDLQQAQEDCDRQRQRDQALVDEKQRADIMALATDVPRLWRDPNASHRDRKRIVRLLLEDATLVKKETITIHVRFKGGSTTTLVLPRPLRAWELLRTPPETVAKIDDLLDRHTDGEVANLLNEEGCRSGTGDAFRGRLVASIRRQHGLKSRYERLRDAGMLTTTEVAEALGISRETAKNWRKRGLLRGHACDGKNNYLFEPPGPNPPVKQPGRKLSERRQCQPLASHRT